MPELGSFKGNGNRFKGNQQKKTGRAKKNAIADFDKDNDMYVRVVSIEGGKHLSVLPLDSSDKKTIMAVIPGKFHKKVWFRKEDILIVTKSGNICEVKGKIDEGSLSKIKSQFEKMDSGNNSDSMVFGNDNDDSDDDEKKDDNTKSDSKTKKEEAFDFDSL